MNELEALLALTLSPHTTPKKAKTLYTEQGSALQVLASHPKGVSEETKKMIEKERAACEKAGVTLLGMNSPDFPPLFKVLPDCPLVLYIKGKLPASFCLGIVGTRAATDWGKECTLQFSKHLSEAGLIIVSGLARGIDTIAHKATFSHSPTVAIIGSGLGNIYPRENETLAREIIEKGGCIMSELPLMTPPSRFSFPKRNRLIACLSDALLLTEAPLKSGAMITMELGFLQKKPCFALPGRAFQENYQGNHSLIQQGKAKLVASIEDLANACGIKLKNNLYIEKGEKITGEEEKMLDLLSQTEESLNDLSCKTGLPVFHLQATLMQLVLKDLVVELPGKRFRRKE